MAEAAKRDTSVTKVAQAHSPHGTLGQKYLALGKRLSMRLWEEPPGKPDSPHHREYETVGYVISGKAELTLEGQKLLLAPGDSWVIPAGAVHSYRILEAFVAVEATAPGAEVQGRDAPPASS